ncbi:hypothetical protein C8Q76DRAFT_789589 [Earliella scabrosa]|nr:hypothetical protein C8Q76DRAFT_789589 [Earliella scabrosa]
MSSQDESSPRTTAGSPMLASSDSETDSLSASSRSSNISQADLQTVYQDFLVLTGLPASIESPEPAAFNTAIDNNESTNFMTQHDPLFLDTPASYGVATDIQVTQQTTRPSTPVVDNEPSGPPGIPHSDSLGLIGMPPEHFYGGQIEVCFFYVKHSLHGFIMCKQTLSRENTPALPATPAPMQPPPPAAAAITPFTILERTFALERVQYDSFRNKGYETGYAQWLQIRLMEQILNNIGISLHHPQPAVFHGCTVTDKDVLAWLGHPRAQKTYNNWRTWYKLACGALRSLAAQEHTLPRTPEEERLFQILQRWNQHDLLPAAQGLPVAAETNWAYLAVTAKASHIGDMCKALKKKAPYSQTWG